MTKSKMFSMGCIVPYDDINIYSERCDLFSWLTMLFIVLQMQIQLHCYMHLVSVIRH